jgi:TonB family protein
MEELRLVPLSDYQDDCRILEVEPGASAEEIRQAYRDQTKVWHPDRFSNDIRLQKKAEERIRQINSAYRRLCGLSPYEQPVLSPVRRGSSSDWVAVFALRRAVRNSVTIISRPFVWLIRKTVKVSTGVFQWCHRERRSLAIATSAFVLGLASGVWLLPRTSETWAKINGPPQAIIEKNGTSQAALAQASPAAPTVPSETRILTASSPETNPPVTLGSVDVSPRATNIATPVFPIGEERVTEEKPTPYERAWEKHWLKSLAAMADTTVWSNYMLISLVPHQNPFYCTLPHNDVEHGQSNPEALNVVPLFRQIHGEPGRVVSRQQLEESIWKPPAHLAAVETSRATNRPDESVVSPSKVIPEKELGERERPANQGASKARQGHRAATESVLVGSAAKAVTMYAPRPDYPEEARSHRVAGSGVCVVSVDPASGSVTNASMAQSTGSLLLDKSVLRTVRTWKFKPRTVSQVSIPVEFPKEGENP